MIKMDIKLMALMSFLGISNLVFGSIVKELPPTGEYNITIENKTFNKMSLHLKPINSSHWKIYKGPYESISFDRKKFSEALVITERSQLPFFISEENVASSRDMKFNIRDILRNHPELEDIKNIILHVIDDPRNSNSLKYEIATAYKKEKKPEIRVEKKVEKEASREAAELKDCQSELVNCQYQLEVCRKELVKVKVQLSTAQERIMKLERQQQAQVGEQKAQYEGEPQVQVGQPAQVEGEQAAQIERPGAQVPEEQIEGRPGAEVEEQPGA